MSETAENGVKSTNGGGEIISRSEFHMSELAETTQEYGRKIAEAASQARDYVGEKATIVGEKLKDLQNKDISEIADEAKEYARRKPGQALLIAAGAGLILGFLLRGGRR